MDKMTDVDNPKDFSDVLQHIQQSRQKIFAQINTALIELYWHIGQVSPTHQLSFHSLWM